MQIGNRVRDLRTAQRMSLTELSQKSGVQMATLSRIEHGKMTGTLDSHLNIAKALGLELPQLYHNLESNSPDETATSGKHGETFAYNAKAHYDILVNSLLSKKMMPIILRIEEGGKTNAEKGAPGSEKFLFLLEGKLTVYIEEETHPLSKNQTLYFNASRKHYFANAGKAPTKAIVVSTPVNL